MLGRYAGRSWSFRLLWVDVGAVCAFLSGDTKGLERDRVASFNLRRFAVSGEDILLERWLRIG